MRQTHLPVASMTHFSYFLLYNQAFMSRIYCEKYLSLHFALSFPKKQNGSPIIHSVWSCIFGFPQPPPVVQLLHDIFYNCVCSSTRSEPDYHLRRGTTVSLNLRYGTCMFCHGCRLLILVPYSSST